MSLKIIFMGTPEFAVPSLKAIFNSPHELLAVVTATDKRGGRGRGKILQSDVKKAAIELDIPILQPGNLKDEQFLQALSRFNADLYVVVAFRMLPKVVWKMPPYGTINLHASLLPDYRGAAPIQWAIINGETTSGLTTFQLKQKVDTGDILLQEKVPIHITDNAENVHDRLMLAGPSILLDTINQLETREVTPIIQSQGDFKKAPKLNRDNTEISFDGNVKDVYNFIRGLAPFPGAWTSLNGKMLKIYDSEIVSSSSKDNLLLPGQVKIDSGDCYVKCGDGLLQILKVQLEGKRRMKTEDFIHGYQEKISRLGDNHG